MMKSETEHDRPPRAPLFRWEEVRWSAVVAAVLMATIGIGLAWSVATNPRFQWPVVGQYLFSSTVLGGFLTTLWLTAVTMVIGVAIGILLALMTTHGSPPARAFAAAYTWFFRGTPVLVQLIFWYNLAALYPKYRIGIPFTDVTFLTGSFNDLITPYTAAILGLGLNEGAYMAEIVRAGLKSVPPGQDDAAKSLGLSRRQGLFLIVLPQAMRFIVPPTGNQTIGMLKTTSIVSIVALWDLLYSVQTIYSRTFQTIPMLIVACVWYLVATTALSLIQARIEAYYNRGHTARATTTNPA
ncbi:amino acid ABC transporter permease [Amaricoccus solimangrovi]|uniref:Glutamate/aspartate import permease protein GltK n=1 Tax=Amaricoccus solimangrovi TaxID=2589815 RepID=A0A501WPM3_9RHOB|nr:amino acid ABC transporter permease [Amaricoccus solimangrovi]TPE47716.1 amino acid ABC transporter permease [Amaricoccus solimangrovi]